MNQIEKSVNLKVAGQCFDVKVKEEEWRMDLDWWLADGDRKSETGTNEGRTESGFCSDYGYYEDLGINEDGIVGEFGGSCDVNQSKGPEDSESLNEEPIGGDDEADSNLKVDKKDELEDADGPRSDRSGGLLKGLKSPSRKEVENSGIGLNRVETVDFISVRGTETVVSAEKKKEEHRRLLSKGDGRNWVSKFTVGYRQIEAAKGKNGKGTTGH
ncbi:hypothetical protein SLA2020_070300 [Shorea laevis]